MPCHSRSARRRVSMQCLPSRCVQFCELWCVRVRVCVVRVKSRLRASYGNAFSLERSCNSLGTDIHPLFPAGALPATIRSSSLFFCVSPFKFVQFFKNVILRSCFCAGCTTASAMIMLTPACLLACSMPILLLSTMRKATHETGFSQFVDRRTALLNIFLISQGRYKSSSKCTS